MMDHPFLVSWAPASPSQAPPHRIHFEGSGHWNSVSSISAVVTQECCSSCHSRLSLQLFSLVSVLSSHTVLCISNALPYLFAFIPSSLCLQSFHQEPSILCLPYSLSSFCAGFHNFLSSLSLPVFIHKACNLFLSSNNGLSRSPIPSVSSHTPHSQTSLMLLSSSCHPHSSLVASTHHTFPLTFLNICS